MREITGEIRNRIFYILVALSISVIAFGCIRGAEQDKQFQADYIQYQQASQLANENRPKEAIAILNPLSEKYPESAILPYEYGIACYLAQDYESSVKYMKEFISRRPVILHNKQFLVQYGEILYRADELDLSRRYLLAGLNGNGDQSSVNNAQKFLQEIEQKKSQ